MRNDVSLHRFTSIESNGVLAIHVFRAAAHGGSKGAKHRKS
jgi:hypothetical protein